MVSASHASVGERKAMLIRLTLALVLVLVATPFADVAADEAPDLGTAVERIIVAYGGAEALSRVGAMRQTGQTVSTMRNATGAMRRIVQGAERLRFEVTYPDTETELRMLDGAEGWRGGVASRRVPMSRFPSAEPEPPVPELRPGPAQPLEPAIRTRTMQGAKRIQQDPHAAFATPRCPK